MFLKDFLVSIPEGQDVFLEDLLVGSSLLLREGQDSFTRLSGRTLRLSSYNEVRLMPGVMITDVHDDTR